LLAQLFRNVANDLAAAEHIGTDSTKECQRSWCSCCWSKQNPVVVASVDARKSCIPVHLQLHSSPWYESGKAPRFHPPLRLGEMGEALAMDGSFVEEGMWVEVHRFGGTDMSSRHPSLL
jgi:hypothetical protein